MTAWKHELGRLPHGKAAPDGPRAASSHSASRGSRFLAKRQYVTASRQCTHETGSCASPRSKVHAALVFEGRAHTRASTHAAYAATVTSVLSIQKERTSTAWRGRSLGAAALSSEPICRRAAGTWSIPSFSSTFTFGDGAPPSSTGGVALGAALGAGLSSSEPSSWCGATVCATAIAGTATATSSHEGPRARIAVTLAVLGSRAMSEKCENCGANLPFIPPGAPSVTCEYCGTTRAIAPPAPPPRPAAPPVIPFGAGRFPQGTPAPVRVAPVVFILPFVFAIVGVIIPIIIFSTRASRPPPPVSIPAVPSFGIALPTGKGDQWDGMHAPEVADLDGDGVEDFVGLSRTVKPDEVHVVAYSGKTFAQLWRTPSYGTFTEANDATRVAIAGGRVVATDFRHAVHVLEGRTGKELGATTTTDKVTHLCAHGGKVWLDVADEQDVDLDPVAIATSRLDRRPQECPSSAGFANVRCRTHGDMPRSRCTSADALPKAAGFAADRVLWDGDVAVAVGTKRPGTRTPMAAGWDAASKRWTWTVALTTSPSASEGGPDVAELAGGRLVATYGIKTGGVRLVAIDAKTGKQQWDVALPQSNTGSGVYDLQLTASRVYAPHWVWLDVLDASSGSVLQTLGSW